MSDGADGLDPTRSAREGVSHSELGGEDVGSVLEVKVLNSVRQLLPQLAPMSDPRPDCAARACNVGAQGTIPVPVQADDRIGTVKRMLADRHFVRSTLYSHLHHAAHLPNLRNWPSDVRGERRPADSRRQASVG